MCTAFFKKYVQVLTSINLFLIVLLLSACGKQGPKETPLQKAERVHAAIAEKYKEEIAVMRTEKDEDIIKKKLGKLIENKDFKKAGWKNGWYRLVRTGGTPDVMPFHCFVELLEIEMKRLQSNDEVFRKFGEDKFVEQSKELRSMLFEMRAHVFKHKEHRNELRSQALHSLQTTTVIF